MNDQHFSVPMPDGTRAMIDVYGGDEFLISIRDEIIRFEFSEQFGPLPLNKKDAGRPLRPSHPFWRAVSLWRLQGSRVEGGKAIWHVPKQPVLKHLGGKHYRVLEHGEPGWNW